MKVFPLYKGTIFSGFEVKPLDEVVKLYEKRIDWTMWSIIAIFFCQIAGLQFNRWGKSGFQKRWVIKLQEHVFAGLQFDR